MRSWPLVAVASVMLIFGAVAFAGPGNTPGKAITEGPVVVELFTSEGCSSCPPADAVLAGLAHTPGIITLAHHVDYWDDLGWPDPFASAGATARQRSYAAQLAGGTYTPQAVIDGSVQLVGSREGALRDAVVEAGKARHTKVALSVSSNREVTVRTMGGRDSEVMVALVQRSAKVAVLRGENGGQTLPHTSIVRVLRSLGPPTGEDQKTQLAPIDARHGPPDFDVVAFVQETRSRRIVGAAVTPLP